MHLPPALIGGLEKRGLAWNVTRIAPERQAQKLAGAPREPAAGRERRCGRAAAGWAALAAAASRGWRANVRGRPPASYPGLRSVGGPCAPQRPRYTPRRP